ncbi:hypothetical protein HOY80DRAFT_894180, partial [Tuber brumale]
KIVDGIGYFTLDDATNNDTAQEHIAKHLQGVRIDFNSVLRRLQCFGHVINLVVKAFF